MDYEYLREGSCSVWTLAERPPLVCDNLNAHSLASLYGTFPPEKALRVARRLEIVHKPKRGS